MDCAGQEGSWWTGVLTLDYLLPEMDVSAMRGGRVRPGALLDSVHIQLRNHGEIFITPLSVPRNFCPLSPVPRTAGGGDVVDFSSFAFFQPSSLHSNPRRWASLFCTGT